MKHFYFKFTKKTCIHLFLGMSLLLLSQRMMAQKTSAQTGNWNTASTWSPSGVPAAGDNVTIAAGHTVTITADITMNAGTTVTVNATGILKNNSSTASTFDKLVVDGTYTNIATVTVRDLLSGGGTFTNTDGNAKLIISGATPTVTTLNVGSTNASTIEYNGATDQTIRNQAYRKLITSGGGKKTLTFTSGTTIQGLTVNSGAKVDVLGGFTLTLGSYGSTVNDALSVTGNLTVSGAGSNGLTNYGTITITNTLTVGTGTNTTYSIDNYGTIGTAGFASGTVGSFTNNTNSTLNYSGGSIPAAMTFIASASGNTVNYNGTTQTVRDVTYSNLVLSNSGTKSISTANAGTLCTGKMTIMGTAKANVANAISSFPVNRLVLNTTGQVTGTIGLSGTSNNNTAYFTTGTGSLLVQNPYAVTSTAAGGDWSSPSTWVDGVVPANNSFDYVIIVGTATVDLTLTAATTVGALDINAGGTLNVYGGVTPFYGFTIASRTPFSNIAGNLNFDANTLAKSLGNLTVASTGVVSCLGGNTSIGSSASATSSWVNNGNFTIGNFGLTTGKTVENNKNFKITSGVGSGSQGVFNNNPSGSVDFTGLLAGTFNNYGTITSANINGSSTVANIYNMSTGVLNCTGTFSGGWTLDASTVAGNTVNYSFAGSQTLKNVVYSNLTLSNTGTKTLGITASGNLCTGTLTIAGTAKANVPAAIVADVNKLILGVVSQPTGTLGSTTATAATKQDNNYFAATTGYLNVTNGDTCNLATPTISAGSATTFCSGGSVTLTSSAASGNQWYKNSVAITSLGTLTTYSPTSSGTYTVMATVGACTALSAGTVVTVNSLPSTPTISAGSATTFCSGGSVTLTSNATSGGYTWYKDGVLIASATLRTYSATTSGTYTVTTTNTTTGCVSATSLGTTVTVNPLPTITPSATATAVSYSGSAQNTSLDYSATTGTPNQYSITWNASPTNSFVGVTNASLSGSPITIAIPAGANAGTYTGNISVRNSTSTCSGASTPFTLTINKATPTVEPIIEVYSYTGGPVGPNTATTASTGTKSFSYAGVDPTVYASSATPPSNAGTYTVTASVAADANYEAASSSATAFTLRKATPTATLEVSNSPVAYTNSAKSATVIASAFSAPGSITNILTGGAATQTASGSYAVTADYVPTDTANYNTLTGVSAGTFVITDSTTWDGTSWSNGTPTSLVGAIIDAAYSTGAGSPQVPFAAKTLIINSGKTVTVASGTNITVADELVNNGTLTVENNANLIQTSAANTNSGSGTATVKRNSNPLYRLDYTMWSSPVTAQNLLEFSPLTSAVTPIRFYQYNPLSDKYVTVDPQANSFLQGRGYLIRMPNEKPGSLGTTTGYYAGTETLAYPGVFTGTLNNGTINLSLLAADKYVSVGNPYPSAISADAFLSGNATAGTLYFWRKKNGVLGTAYATYTYAGGVGEVGVGDSKLTGITPNGTIEVGQGFIVKATTTALNFTNTMRTTSAAEPKFFKTKKVADKSRVWLNLSDAKGGLNQAMIAYIDGATLGVDAGYEGKYFNDSAIALTSTIDNEEYVIQARPTFDATDVVALGFKTDVAGDYSIALDSFDGVFESGQDVYLVDAVAGKEIDLKAGAYNFTATAGVDNARFSLKYQKTLKVDAPAFNENSVKVYKNNGVIYVNSTSKAIKTIVVYDLQGRLIAQQKNVNATTATISNLKAVRQVLIVKVSADDNSVVSKKVLN